MVLAATDSVLLDAEVLFRSRVLRLFAMGSANGAFRARWSEEIIDEAERNLLEKERFAALKALPATLDLVRDPLVNDYKALEPEFPATDEKDRHVAAAAAACDAKFLVTGNWRHFDVNEAEHHGFTVMHPDTFGVMLMETNPAAVLRGIQRTPEDRFFSSGLPHWLPKCSSRMPPLFSDKTS